MKTKAIGVQGLTHFSLILLLMTAALPAFSEIYRLTKTKMVGELYEIVVQPGDVGFRLARQHGIGFEEFAKANPHINRHWVKPGEKLVIPKRHILPGNVKKHSIVVNLAEKRLYYYTPRHGTVTTYPITVGRRGWATPNMNTSVVNKKENPVWRVPASIKAEAKKHGVHLPDRVPPGPDNPLGDHALYLGRDSILIHGTNSPNDIGLRLSSGCIRMHPDDVRELFYRVKVGTSVRIIDVPYKAVVHDGMLYVEGHMTMKERWSRASREAALKKALAKVVPQHVINKHYQKIRQYAFKHLGVPQPVVRVAPSQLVQETPFTKAKQYSKNEKF